jgi:hypothetical protein
MDINVCPMTAQYHLYHPVFRIASHPFYHTLFSLSSSESSAQILRHSKMSPTPKGLTGYHLGSIRSKLTIPQRPTSPLFSRITFFLRARTQFSENFIRPTTSKTQTSSTKSYRIPSTNHSAFLSTIKTQKIWEIKAFNSSGKSSRTLTRSELKRQPINSPKNINAQHGISQGIRQQDLMYRSISCACAELYWPSSASSSLIRLTWLTSMPENLLLHL